jgi:hypothetical protein
MRNISFPCTDLARCHLLIDISYVRHLSLVHYGLGRVIVLNLLPPTIDITRYIYVGRSRVLYNSFREISLQLR